MRISDWSSDVCSSDLSKLGRPDTGFSRWAEARRRLRETLALIAAIRHSAAPIDEVTSMAASTTLAAISATVTPSAIGVNQCWRRVVKVSSSTASESARAGVQPIRSEEHTSELQSLMRTSYAVFCLKKKNKDK